MRVNLKENPTNKELSEAIAELKSKLDLNYLKNTSQHFSQTEFRAVQHEVNKRVDEQPKDSETSKIKREFAILERRYSEYINNYVIGKAKAKLRHAVTKKEKKPNEKTDMNKADMKQKVKMTGSNLKMRFFSGKKDVENKRKSLSEEEMNKTEPPQKKQQ